jgi:hypothetical protein
LQHKRFVEGILANRVNRAILQNWDVLQLDDAWLAAGCLFQTIWNQQAGRAPEEGIRDYDIFYFDESDLSPEAEERAQVRIDIAFRALGAVIEVKNQARVHLWYEEHFGFPYPRLSCAKDGIDRFLIPSTCVAVRPDRGGFEVYAPHGLDGLYAGVLTPNPLVSHFELFRNKAASYKQRWQWLDVRASA